MTYCPTCRAWFVLSSTPPHAVIHTVKGHPLYPAHLHAITREELEPING